MQNRRARIEARRPCFELDFGQGVHPCMGMVRVGVIGCPHKIVNADLSDGMRRSGLVRIARNETLLAKKAYRPDRASGLGSVALAVNLPCHCDELLYGLEVYSC